MGHIRTDKRLRPTRALTPEEDAIGDPEDEDDEIDDLLPADLWFRGMLSKRPPDPTSGR